ncbi:MAG: hypothetical protein R3316_07900 [Rhodovibrionaceae bacterium]|nr:hypothetical protein [Rhodovibrionaceae bacterium]
MDNTHERLRIFIVNPGRVGSSLLSVIMADAGADFGMPAPREWQPGQGEMEHPEMTAAADGFARAHALSAEKPVSRLLRWRWDLERHRAKGRLAVALPKARFFKADNLDLAVRPALQAGYLPRVVLNYRRFGDHAKSLYLRRGHLSVDRLAARYERICANGLMLLYLFGGCAVEYEELADASQTAWAGALAEAMGLDRGRLLQAREARVSLRSRAGEDERPPVLVPRLESLYEEMRAYSGRAVAPSEPARRNWERALERQRQD